MWYITKFAVLCTLLAVDINMISYTTCIILRVIIVLSSMLIKDGHEHEHEHEHRPLSINTICTCMREVFVSMMIMLEAKNTVLLTIGLSLVEKLTNSTILAGIAYLMVGFYIEGIAALRVIIFAFVIFEHVFAQNKYILWLALILGKLLAHGI
jgi:hypothetical protein